MSKKKKPNQIQQLKRLPKTKRAGRDGEEKKKKKNNAKKNKRNFNNNSILSNRQKENTEYTNKCGKYEFCFFVCAMKRHLWVEVGRGKAFRGTKKASELEKALSGRCSSLLGLLTRAQTRPKVSVAFSRLLCTHYYSISVLIAFSVAYLLAAPMKLVHSIYFLNNFHNY